jgi:uncharacterized GH25 family protein
MRKITVLLIALATYFVSENASAHAVWIQSNPKANKNKAHEVNVFYGEYPSGETDSTAKWYSDLKNLEVWVVSPSQRKTKLVLKDLATHLTASFTPEEDGLYYISSVHEAKDLGGTTKYEFSSLVPILSGKAGPAVIPAPSIPLAIVFEPKPYRSNEVIEIQVKKASDAFAAGEVLIMSPEGWVKTMKTDDQGKVSFNPPVKGRYVIEASDYKKEAGNWNDKAFTHTWKGATTSFIVN